MQTLTTADGLSLLRHDWPIAGPARGRVLIVHGLGEHGGRYAALAAALNGAGWGVHAHDQRGHGRSGGARGALPHAEALLEDLGLVIDTLPAGGPLVLLGHSMGGLVAARFVAEAVAPAPAAWSRRPAALVLSSPALDAGLGGFQRVQLALGGALVPDRAVGNGLKPAWISRDPAVVRDYEADPLVHDRITPRLVRFIVDGGAVALAAAPRWPVPTLLMWAGADRCVAPRGSAAFAAAAPPEMVQARAWPDLSHEIFNEPERAEVVSALLGWLEAHAPPR
jgi:alpha-beta hydrolase superfamily lysophospholipase